jgi:hypothetical protein
MWLIEMWLVDRMASLKMRRKKKGGRVNHPSLLGLHTRGGDSRDGLYRLVVLLIQKGRKGRGESRSGKSDDDDDDGGLR